MAGKKKPGQASRAQQQADAARRRGGGIQAGRGTATPPAAPEKPAAPAPSETAPKAPAASQHYLDVSAVRIQDWLARTPDLKFRRGASALLTQATGRASWLDGKLPSGIRWNDEAGDVDGVVSLVLDQADTDDPELDIARIAHQVAQTMRKEMPYCPIQAVTGTGTSYVEAYKGMEQARQAGRLLINSPAVPPEVIVAKPCDQCRSAAATQRAAWKTDEGTRDLCDDCDARLKAAGRTAGSQRWEPRPERLLRKAMGEAGVTVVDFPDNMQQLADAGRIDKDDTPSQVALIYADGNAVGAFLSAAATSNVPKQDIVPMIEAATMGALADAVLDRYRGWGRPPVLANLVGGDDLLVSVPAADAWQFTRVLLAAFGQRIAQETADWRELASVQRPSLSAGLVFHHVKAPFSDLVRLVGDQLREAKNATRGKEASVAFLDLTADGATAPQGRRPLSLADLDKQAGRLGRIEKETPSSRQAMLLDLLRLGDTDRFSWRLTELDNPTLWEVVAGPGALPSAVRDELERNLEAITELRRVLDMARHWHADSRTEPESKGRAA
jgi:hypothetical protein